ncbi:hypothetical protein ABZS29_00140 [Kribbella sp. NPDC005582]|uniref:hypothetical protein n=1 Tax=Kribbella sp. NPDC005582 TaxID=3156893 RepID=UPI0033B755D6
MLWPALRALSYGDLSAEQLTWLRERFGLTDGPRTEGPGAAQSLAHQSLTDPDGTPVVLDLASTGTSGWVLTLFHTGAQPSAASVASLRTAFRDAIEQLGLTLVEIEPAATADEVLVPSADPGAPDSAFAAHWELPGELDQVWSHLGVLRDAPREVKQVKLRELMATPAWHAAPAGLQQEAQDYLNGH